MMTANHVSDQFNASRPLSLFTAHKREEKPLHHIAMVANFLDDNKSKRHLKSGFTLFQLHRSYFTSFKGTVSRLCARTSVICFFFKRQ